MDGTNKGSEGQVETGKVDGTEETKTETGFQPLSRGSDSNVIAAEFAKMVGKGPKDEKKDESQSGEVPKGEEGEKDEEGSETGSESKETGASDEDGSGSEEGDTDSETVGGLKSEIQQLKEQLDELKGLLNQKSETKEEKKEEKIELTPPDLSTLITDQELEDALDDKKHLRALLTKVTTAIYDKAVKDITVQMSGVVDTRVSAGVSLHSTITDFWRRNKDLLEGDAKAKTEVKAKAGVIAQRLQAANPGWDLDELFVNVEKELRVKLGKKTPVEKKTETADAKKGAFVQTAGKGGRAEPPKVSKIQQELNAMMGKRAK